MEVHAAIVRIALAFLINGLELLLKSVLDSFLDEGRKFPFGLVGLVLRLVIPSLVLALTLCWMERSIGGAKDQFIRNCKHCGAAS